MLGQDLTRLLLVLAPGVPAALAVTWTLPGFRARVVALAPWAGVPAFVLALGHLLGLSGPVAVDLPSLVSGLRLALDDVGAAFLLLTSGLWVAAGVFAGRYHSTDPHRDRFFAFFLLTLSGNVGVAVAGEVLTFYLFFALMTFSAYGLVVHKRDRTAWRAGRIYIVLALAGEIAILTGVLVLSAVATGPVAFGPELEAAWDHLVRDGLGAQRADPSPGPHLPGLGSPEVVAGLLLGGFAVKVGLVPLHLWLPLAHPVAPTAASALLSGVMVKAGVMGWLRFVPGDFAPSAVASVLVGAGVATAFYGVIIGLGQDNPKTVLAYSTVSQMGYLAVGTGILLLAPEVAPLALTAVVAYALHHGVAKSALFLSVGLVDRLPGRPASRVGQGVLLAGIGVPALSLAGLTLTSGAQAKAILKTALAELGGAWYSWLDPLLLVAAVGTTLLMARFAFTLVPRLTAEETESRGPSRGLLASWGVVVAAGILGPFWIPSVVPDPGGLGASLAVQDPKSTLFPVLVGVAVAWWVLRRPSLGEAVHRFRIPEGDLVVPLEAAVARIPRPDQEGWLDRLLLLRERVEAVFLVPVARALEELAQRDLRLMRGVVLGFLIIALSLAFTGALG